MFRIWFTMTKKPLQYLQKEKIKNNRVKLIILFTKDEYLLTIFLTKTKTFSIWIKWDKLQTYSKTQEHDKNPTLAYHFTMQKCRT